ncbi:MAG: Cys-tRNA(Pro) deacylase [Actinomycetota bacterium]|nr:Cys-tRNA(Pro) deacylase [Actinomycetota bacterium]
MRDAPTPAVATLARAGIAHRVHRYEHDPATASFGREAAEALAVDDGRVCKTLVASVDGGLVVAVLPVDTELDMKALASAMGAKRAGMADPALAERATGYLRGGISPVGQKRRLPTVVDERALRWDTVFVSGGRRGLELEIRPDDLVRATGGRVAAIARPADRRSL